MMSKTTNIYRILISNNKQKEEYICNQACNKYYSPLCAQKY